MSRLKKIYSQGQVLKNTTELNNTGLLQLVFDTDCIVDSVADCLKDLDAYLSRFYVGWEILKKKRDNKNKQSRNSYFSY
tara:strand:- start:1343 stop:1579 length:237 start_codon:yes stop_codon:yes gene_type:complete